MSGPGSALGEDPREAEKHVREKIERLLAEQRLANSRSAVLGGYGPITHAVGVAAMSRIAAVLIVAAAAEIGVYFLYGAGTTTRWTGVSVSLFVIGGVIYVLRRYVRALAETRARFSSGEVRATEDGSERGSRIS
jgi:hypothetical protein